MAAVRDMMLTTKTDWNVSAPFHQHVGLCWRKRRHFYCLIPYFWDLTFYVLWTKCSQHDSRCDPDQNWTEHDTFSQSQCHIRQIHYLLCVFLCLILCWGTLSVWDQVSVLKWKKRIPLKKFYSRKGITNVNTNSLVCITSKVGIMSW